MVITTKKSTSNTNSSTSTKSGRRDYSCKRIRGNSNGNHFFDEYEQAELKELVKIPGSAIVCSAFDFEDYDNDELQDLIELKAVSSFVEEGYRTDEEYYTKETNKHEWTTDEDLDSETSFETLSSFELKPPSNTPLARSESTTRINWDDWASKVSIYDILQRRMSFGKEQQIQSDSLDDDLDSETSFETPPNSPLGSESTTRINWDDWASKVSIYDILQRRKIFCQDDAEDDNEYDAEDDNEYVFFGGSSAWETLGESKEDWDSNYGQDDKW